jgi:hypothetical protein
MGGSSFSFDAAKDLSRSYATKSTATIFKNRNLSPDLDPKGLAFREARDSDGHPNSFPIIVGLDTTGSMGSIPENLVRNKLGKLMEILINNGVEDASICFLGIGDHYANDAPLQVGQFESGTSELDKCLTSIWLEGGGGGQVMESYHLAWLFGARHTSTDSFEKRNIKGFIFTIGDEYVHDKLESKFLERYMGYKEATEVKMEDLLEEAKKTYNVFHIHCNDGSYQSSVSNLWKKLLGENLIIVEDSDTIPEVIASTVAIINGADMKKLLSTMDAKTASSVSTALATVKKADITNYANVGIIKL